MYIHFILMQSNANEINLLLNKNYKIKKNIITYNFSSILSKNIFFKVYKYYRT